MSALNKGEVLRLKNLIYITSFNMSFSILSGLIILKIGVWQLLVLNLIFSLFCFTYDLGGESLDEVCIVLCLKFFNFNSVLNYKNYNFIEQSIYDRNNKVSIIQQIAMILMIIIFGQNPNSSNVSQADNLSQSYANILLLVISSIGFFIFSYLEIKKLQKKTNIVVVSSEKEFIQMLSKLQACLMKYHFVIFKDKILLDCPALIQNTALENQSESYSLQVDQVDCYVYYFEKLIADILNCKQKGKANFELVPNLRKYQCKCTKSYKDLFLNYEKMYDIPVEKVQSLSETDMQNIILKKFVQGQLFCTSTQDLIKKYKEKNGYFNFHLQFEQIMYQTILKYILIRDYIQVVPCFVLYDLYESN
ncbi:transmembrane protein, putative (macronuclear) [Tetrahymena thermophila SB210]|uniref:Transmembrane protein, putative n=1 Tax=Tetrahymena thermophila (strain SB210) TaxID=312017 RepID=I7M1B6_TETTS|nr:transmembrane protein, putative [Tetrahymena thermophila SB210]EAR96011.1 transmembrane protein, putative [Tetrahymena thermophila SB210]|eukprot:XP_001016256.1 transmembrane protein, putative [Tetrahymena thermophila SB210]